MSTAVTDRSTLPSGRKAGAWLRSSTPHWYAASGTAGLSGLVTAGLLPRGPTTGAEVAALMAGSLLVGVLAGLMVRSRWVAVWAPALHLAVFELARFTVFEVAGPTLDRPRFDVTMGVAVFLAAHVMYAVTALTPMVLGAVIGCAVARRRLRREQPPPSRSWLRSAATGMRWALAALLAACAGTIAGQLLRPGHVAPIPGVPGSIAALQKVRLGGVDQWISLRGRSAANPVLLHLSGGPGSSDVGWVRTFNQPLEERFTVVVWEQRGVGKSYPALDPTTTFTLDRIVSDGVELAGWLARRFDQPKIYLTGNSWGSTLGVLMVQRRPELFHAYAGTGQMVSQRATDRVLYHQLLAYAERTGNTTLRDQLRGFGSPPYRDVFAYAKVMEYYHVIEPYQPTREFEQARGLSGFFPDEYSLLDTWNEIRGFADMGGLLYPQLQELDFRATVPRLEVPVYFMQGRHELTARSRLADEWIGGLRAPIKRVYEFAHSGHNPDAEEPARFNDLMINTVLAETYRR
jgi:proline iminopeptidase